MKSWRVCSGIRFFLINSTRNPNYKSRSLILLLRFALATIHSSFRKYVCDMTRGFIELLTFMLVILHNKSSRFFVSMSTKSSFFWSFDILTKMFPEFCFRQRSEKIFPIIRQFCLTWTLYHSKNRHERRHSHCI